ncbi:MAG: hypothetical protein IIT53_09835 [Fibrobacter sp.]|nr:hypothetical protein [Fibrobacter sp.]
MCNVSQKGCFYAYFMVPQMHSGASGGCGIGAACVRPIPYRVLFGIRE